MELALVFTRRDEVLLAAEFGEEWGVLVEVLAESRAAALERNGGIRDVDFATWARRWAQALDGDLAGMVREGRAAEVAEIVRSALAGEPRNHVGGHEGEFHCRSCDRRFSVMYLGLGPSPSDAVWVSDTR